MNKNMLKEDDQWDMIIEDTNSIPKDFLIEEFNQCT